MIGKLNILEPWEFGTEKSILIKDIDKSKTQFLLYTNEPYVINGNPYNFFLARLRGNNKTSLFSITKDVPIFLEMIYDENLNSENFMNYQIENFNNHFLLGELKFINNESNQ